MILIIKKIPCIIIEKHKSYFLIMYKSSLKIYYKYKYDYYDYCDELFSLSSKKISKIEQWKDIKETLK